MYIKYHGFKCECEEVVAPDFYELHFNMIDGEILDSYANEIVCKKCGAVYELDDMEFTPIFNRKDKRDKYGCWVRVCPTKDGEYVELGRG